MHDYHTGGNGANGHAPSSSRDAEDEVVPHGSGEDDGASVPLVAQHRIDQGDTIFDGDEEESSVHQNGGSGASAKNELVPYAHRDLKPGCVEPNLSSDGNH